MVPVVTARCIAGRPAAAIAALAALRTLLPDLDHVSMTKNQVLGFEQVDALSSCLLRVSIQYITGMHRERDGVFWGRSGCAACRSQGNCLGSSVTSAVKLDRLLASGLPKRASRSGMAARQTAARSAPSAHT